MMMMGMGISVWIPFRSARKAARGCTVVSRVSILQCVYRHLKLRPDDRWNLLVPVQMIERTFPLNQRQNAPYSRNRPWC